MFKKCMGSQNKFDGLSLTNSLWAENNSFLGTPLGEASQFGHLKCWRLYQLWIKIKCSLGKISTIGTSHIYRHRKVPGKSGYSAVLSSREEPNFLSKLKVEELNVEEHCLSCRATSTSLPYPRSCNHSAKGAKRRRPGCRVRWRRKVQQQEAPNPSGLRILLQDKTSLAFSSLILLEIPKYHLCCPMIKRQ